MAQATTEVRTSFYVYASYDFSAALKVEKGKWSRSRGTCHQNVIFCTYPKQFIWYTAELQFPVAHWLHCFQSN